MRKLILFASVFALAAPAAAAPPRHPVPPRREVRRPIPSPAEIEAMGAAIARVTDALMAVDVGPVGDALDPYRRPGRRETLGDVAGRDDPYARERMHRTIGSTSAGMAAAVNELEIMTPLLRRSIEDAARRIEVAAQAGAYPRYRDDDRDYDRYDRDNDRDSDRDYDREDARDREADEPR